MTRRSGLGKGLGSLIPMADPAAAAAGDSDRPVLVEIPVADVTPNPHQPRVHFDEESLAELASSIAQLGVLQPVLVRRVGERYQLIAGERRWRAARRAGLATCRRSSAPPTTCARSSRRWSRTSTARTSRRSRRRPPTSS